MGTVIGVSIIAGVTLTLVIAVTIPLFLLLRKRQRVADMAAVDAIMAKINQEAETAVDEIQRTAKLALEDIDERYQDILFLYNLLEEKKKELAALTDALQAKATPKRKPRTTAAASVSVPRVVPKQRENARYGRIKELSQQGLTIQEIAKTLDMGQGEVKLIMELTGT